MILHYPDARLPLREYGILVPIAPDRTGPVLNALRAHAGLGSRESEWLLEPDGSEITREDLLRVNTTRYVERLFGPDVEVAVTEAFELINPDGSFNRYDPSLARRPLELLFEQTLRWVAGSYQCGREALTHGFCFYLGGGSHHGHPDFGHGFCIVNDSAIAVRKLQAEGRIDTAWIIDVDAHKGDGTAAMMLGDESVTTLSVHMAHGWPLDQPEFDDEGRRHASFIPSDIDVGIDEGEEADYVPRLADALSRLAERDAATGGMPDIAFVLAGADPYERDELESTQKLKLTLDQMNERNLLIYEFLSSRAVPQAWLMAGGYGEGAWETYPALLEHVLLERLNPAP